jgi:beta-N-acetylhexosaminidase
MPAASSFGAEPAPPRRAAVVGVAGTRLDARERDLFQDQRPLGFILFARNCDHPAQLRALVGELRVAIDDPDALVLIDQEGGRVARLRPPHWPARPAAGSLGRLALIDQAAGDEAAHLHARLIAADLTPLGITVDCAPVLDLALPGHTAAIGDRALAADPTLVARLGQAMIDGFLAGGVLPVIKHLPGHGRAQSDSHLELPVVEASAATLRTSDWLPFQACREAPLAMTGHLLFPALDALRPATLSATIIAEVVRGEIGFDGALFSDDLSMGALHGTLGERAVGALEAGCDIALHCNGDFAEMALVLAAAGPLEGLALARVERARARRQPPSPFDPAAGEARLAELLQALAPLEAGV